MTAIENAKTENTAFVLLENIIEKLVEDTTNNVINMYDFKNQIWFWRKIMQKKLIKYLEIASDTTLAASAQSLLYAFTYPGTREGLIRLAHGIFGSFSTIFVEDDKEPAVVGIKIKNSNEHNYIALALEKMSTLSTEDQDFVLLTMDLEKTIQHDTHYFFKQFMTSGRTLKDISIEEGD